MAQQQPEDVPGNVQGEKLKLLIENDNFTGKQMDPMPIEFSNHALRQMEARSIAKEIILSVIQQPDHTVKQDQSTTIFTRLIEYQQKRYLYRVFVNTAKSPMLIITAYKTSKIDKYGYPLR